MAAQSDILFRLVYASQVHPACLRHVELTLCDIQALAIPNNRAMGVTSLLLAHRGWFIQLIEGPEDGARRAFNAIRADGRHRTVRLMIEEAAPGLLPDLALGVRVLSRADTAVLRGFDAVDGFDPTVLSNRALLRLMAVVSEAHGDRLAAQQRMAVRATMASCA